MTNLRRTALGGSGIGLAICVLGALALASFSLCCGGGAEQPVGVSRGIGGLSFSAASLGFGSQPVGTTSSAKSITLTNSGVGAVSIGEIGITGSTSDDFLETNNCADSLGAGASCELAVLFAPVAAGARAAVLNVSNNAGQAAQSVSLSGSGSHDVILKWAAGATGGVVGYFVYRGTTSGAESSKPLNYNPVNATFFADANVMSGATYFYTVRAVGADGITRSPASNETAATVP